MSIVEQGHLSILNNQEVGKDRRKAIESSKNKAKRDDSLDHYTRIKIKPKCRGKACSAEHL
jgi:hypothetical protein